LNPLNVTNFESFRVGDVGLSVLHALGSLLGPSWDGFGIILGGSRAILGILGPPWEALGLFWDSLGIFLVPLNVTNFDGFRVGDVGLAVLRALGILLGPSWDGLGIILGGSRAILGILGPS